MAKGQLQQGQTDPKYAEDPLGAERSAYTVRELPEPWRKYGTPSNLVIGESNYTKAFKALLKERLARERALFAVTVKFERDPGNPHGAEAIFASVHGHKLGHLVYEVAEWLAPIMDKQQAKAFELPGIIDAFHASGGGWAFACHVWHDECLDKRPWMQKAMMQIGGYRVSRWPPPDHYTFEAL